MIFAYCNCFFSFIHFKLFIDFIAKLCAYVHYNPLYMSSLKKSVILWPGAYTGFGSGGGALFFEYIHNFFYRAVRDFFFLVFAPLEQVLPPPQEYKL